MADVEIDVSGNLSTPEQPTRNLSNLLPVPGHIKDWLLIRRQNIRPWTTFFNTNLFRGPSNFQLLPKRIIRNLEYFLSNYLIVFIILTVYCLITNPLLMLAMCISYGACHVLSSRNSERPVLLFGRPITLTKHQQYMLVGIVSLPVYYWAGAGSAVFWVLGASFCIIGLHAAFFNISALQLSDDDHFDLILETV